MSLLILLALLIALDVATCVWGYDSREGAGLEAVTTTPALRAWREE